MLNNYIFFYSAFLYAKYAIHAGPIERITNSVTNWLSAFKFIV